MQTYNQGDIVSVDFPFSDKPEESKQRPAAIISNTSSNSLDADLILVQITSTTRVTPFSYPLDNRFLSRSLPMNSEVRCNKIFTARRNLINKKVSSIYDKNLTEILDLVWQAIRKE